MKKISTILVLCGALSVHTARADEVEANQESSASFDFGTLQGSVSFTYDAAGNRTSRTIVLQQNAMRTMSVLDDEMPEDEYNEQPFVDVLNNNLQVKIFPNPTRGHLAIEIAGADVENVQIRLFAVNGVLLLTKQAAPSRTAVDLSAFPAGTYILLLTIDGVNRQYTIVKL